MHNPLLALSGFAPFLCLSSLVFKAGPGSVIIYGEEDNDRCEEVHSGLPVGCFALLKHPDLKIGAIRCWHLDARIALALQLGLLRRLSRRCPYDRTPKKSPKGIELRLDSGPTQQNKGRHRGGDYKSDQQLWPLDMEADRMRRNTLTTVRIRLHASQGSRTIVGKTEHMRIDRGFRDSSSLVQKRLQHLLIA